LRPDLERLTSARGVADGVDFTGSVTDETRDRELGTAAVFALPARLPQDGSGEGFGIVFLEAGTFGLPVVAGRAAGAIDAVVDGETGVLLDDPTDHVALAEALIGLLTDQVTARTMGERGRAHSEHFSWTRMAASVERVCLDVIGERR
jgi:phosphatidylinositol alpha-1,6-mannosyltransferase